MRPFKFLLTLFFACCLLNNSLGAQCSGTVGVPILPSAICQGNQADINIGGLGLPDGYSFQLFMTTSAVFSFAEVVYQSNVQAIFDDTLPAGTYYLYSAIAPTLPDGTPDYSSPCLQLSPAFEFLIVDLVLNDIPDTVFATCADPGVTVDFVQSPSEGVAVDIWLDGIQIAFGFDPSFSTATAGFYQANIFAGDGLGCTASASFHLVFSDFVLPQERTFSVPCTGDYQVCIEPWDAAQSYELDGLPITDPCIDNLAPGFHQLDITRPGCSNTEQVGLQVINSLPRMEVANGFANCNEADGSITVTINNGTPPYQLSQDGIFVQEVLADGNGVVLSDLAVGTYNYELIDAFGCTANIIGTVNQGPLFSSVEFINATCPTSSDGGLVIIPGNDPPYTYLWDNGSTGAELQNVPPGTYSVTIISGGGCSSDNTLAVGSDSNLDAFAQVNDASCSLNDGSIDLFIVGGVQPYTYSWSTGATTEDLDNLAPGDYSVTITSDSGCSKVIDLVVATVNNINYSASVTDESCGDLADGSISFTLPLAGGLPLTFDWEDLPGSDDPMNRTNLAGGIYSVTISNDAGCVVQDEFSVDPSVFHPGEVTVDGSLECDGEVQLSLAVPGAEILSVEWRDVIPFPTVIGSETDISVFSSSLYFVNAEIRLGDGMPCLVREAVFVEGGIFDIILAPGLPCTPSEISPPPGIYENFTWQVPEGAVVNADNSVTALETGWYVASATATDPVCELVDSLFLSAPIGCNELGGVLLFDEGNCLTGEDEIPIPGARIEILPINGNPAEVQYAYTDFDGNWSALVPFGTYAIQFLPYVDGLYLACDPPFEATITPSGPTPFVELLVTPIEDCPRINVDLAIPLLRRCFESHIYVQYCNEGTSPAIDPSITVELDEFLIFQSALPAPTEVSGTTLTFALSDLEPFGCGQIRISVLTSCEAVLGQSHCVEVTASPNDPCPLPSEEWDGAIVNVRPVCNEENQPAFILENTGFGDMSVPLQYIIVEDGVILMPEQVTLEPLAVGQEIMVELPGDGASYWIQTNQEPLSPGASMPTAFLENCSFDEQGNFSTGFANQFFDGDDLPWYEQRCLANIGAYDPNDKQAIPIGYGSPHYVEPETPIEYTIRFQNTGTDTAFNVYILDELSPLLNPESLRLGASSHEFRASIDSNRTLDIRFDNIMLPDSNVDLAGSQGFVQFTILPYPDLPLPSLIENEAGIYFDFNEPVITNTVFHTVDTGFVRLPSSVFNTPRRLADISLSPNPTPDGQVRIDLTTTIPGPYLVVVLDGLGRRLTTLPINGSTDQLQLGDLPAGTYQLAVFDRVGRWLVTAQLVR